jgi:TusA-related sulfurtransferase
MNKATIDARNLLCPMPVIRVQDAVAGMRPGTLVTALCTDPGALADIPAWCRINGHQVLSTRSEDHLHIVELQVGEG